MGRSIPSFRYLLEIEKLKMTAFKKMLPTKNDKQEFEKLFDNVRLYTSYLGNASNPVPLESVFMGALFHNYKQILQITRKFTKIDESNLEDDLISIIENKSECKILFYRFSKKWNGFFRFLHKDDKLILLKMVLEICSYNECVINIINVRDSQASIDYLFFILAIMLQQKRIDTINVDKKREKGKSI